MRKIIKLLTHCGRRNPESLTSAWVHHKASEPNNLPLRFVVNVCIRNRTAASAWAGRNAQCVSDLSLPAVLSGSRGLYFEFSLFLQQLGKSLVILGQGVALFGFLRREAPVVLIGDILAIGKFPGCSGSLHLCYQVSYPSDLGTEWVTPN